MGAWGFDLAGRDTAASPGGDFFRYANGSYMEHWRSRRPLPLRHLRLPAPSCPRTACTPCSRRPPPTPPPPATRPRSAPSTAASWTRRRVEALGAKPLAADLAAVRAAKHPRARSPRLMGRANDSYFGSSSSSFGIDADAKDPKRYAVYIGQGGPRPARPRLLPGAELRRAEGQAYQAYVAKMLTLAGWPDAEARSAKAIVAMETEIAKVSWTRAEQRDPVKTYNPMTPGRAGEAARPASPGRPSCSGADLGGVQPRGRGREHRLPEDRGDLRRHAARRPCRPGRRSTSPTTPRPTCPRRFADAHFEFRSKTLSGQPEQQAALEARRRTWSTATIGEARGQGLRRRLLPAGVQGQDGGAGRRPARPP